MKSVAVIVANYPDKDLASKVAYIQAECIDRRLPLALLVIVDFQERSLAGNDLFNQINSLYIQLEKYNIPLILMLGDYTEKLELFINHYKPQLINIAKNIDNIGQKNLKKHPYNWPNKVLSPLKLEPNFFKEAKTC